MCTHQKRHLVRRETGKGLLKEVPGDGAGPAAGQSPGEDEPILYLSMHHRKLWSGQALQIQGF